MDSNIIKGKHKTLKKKAFTLVELIIVLAVMAIIAAVAIPNLTGVSERAKEKADNQSIASIERTVSLLLTDESLQVPTGNKVYNISFNTEGKIVFDTENSVLADALTDIKKPQVSGKTGYRITISENGDVTVVTTPIEEA